MWIDLKAYGIDSKTMQKELIEHGVYVNGGYNYIDTNTHIRINIATSMKNLEAAYHRIASYILHKTDDNK